MTKSVYMSQHLTKSRSALFPDSVRCVLLTNCTAVV